jgi:hypothetical protein
MSTWKTLIIAASLLLSTSTGGVSETSSSESCEIIKSTFRNHIETIFLVEAANFRIKNKSSIDPDSVEEYDDALSHYDSRLSFETVNIILDECPFRNRRKR